MNYYNEFDPKTAAWLRELIKQRLIPNGVVDERSIIDVRPDELREYTQCHFFAGIGGWSYALQLAGWPEDEPVWTGSCPCQPFSSAGKGLGESDSRHLWPVLSNLIRDCQPSVVFGEQVASKAGREWLAGVFANLEGMEYRRAGADLCSPGVSAPHIRQRLYWVADAGHLPRRNRAEPNKSQLNEASGCRESLERMVNSECKGLERHGQPRSLDARNGRQGWIGKSAKTSSWDEFKAVKCRDGKYRRVPSEPTFSPLANGIPARVVRLRGYGNAIVPQVAAEFVKAFLES